MTANDGRRTPHAIRYLLSALLCLLLLPACRPEAPPLADGTARMVERLDSIATATERDPRRNPHANRARVAQLAQVAPPEEPRRLAAFRATLGREQLHAGYNEDAIATFSSILDLAEAHPAAFDAGYALAVRDLLAISYLRLGEQENCIDNHNADRCLWPVEGGGVHTKERGARSAIAQYERILGEDPDDLNARWLLNIAHMTLGAYPEGVPARWRIPPEALAAEHDVGRFRDVATGLGLDVMGLSGGVVVDDLNGDGYLDVMVSSWGLRDPLRYFESTGDGRFAERTEAAGLAGLTGGLNLVHADYDNDGDVDVFVLRGAWLDEGHPNSLLRNDGGGTFSDVTEAAGLLSFHPTQTAAWADYDGDGDLDLVVGNESSPAKGRHPAELFRNDGDGTFTEVAAQTGLDLVGYVKAVVWGDYDDDGDPDLYASDWSAPNRLFRNDGGRFTDVTEEAGVGEPVESFPAWFFDYDNDGRLDLFVSGWRASAADAAAEYLGLPRNDARPRLYRNRGDGTFEDVTARARLDRVLYTMGSNFGDLDNDGWLDLYAGTGDPDFRSILPNRMFRNAEGEYFQDVTASGGFGHLQKGHGVAFADLDNDGDQDVYAVIGGAYEGDVYHNVLFENPGHGHAWVTLRLEGVRANRSAVGARLRLDLDTPAGPRTLYRTVGTGGSFGAQSLQEEIGLGDATAVRRLEIRWPGSGTVQRFEAVPMNRILRIREGAESLDDVRLDPFDLSPEAAAPETGGHHAEH